MTPPPDLVDKDAIIAVLMARMEALTATNAWFVARIAELEAKLDQPPKTPDNSSLPPSKGQKASESSNPKPKGRPHPGAYRALHPNPTRRHPVFACSCQGCGADVRGVPQCPSETYDRIEIPKIEPDVTQVSLYGGVRPGCCKRFKAKPPEGLEPGSHPPGQTRGLRALVIYLRSVQNIPLARLSDVLRDLLGLEISEGALGDILRASRKAFARQTNLLKLRLLSGTALASDETGVRVGKANWWLWVFHYRDTTLFVVDPHRSKAVVESFLGEWRPDYWISDRLGSQTGWAKKDHQFCLSHLIRDVQYAIDQGDAVPGLA